MKGLKLLNSYDIWHGIMYTFFVCECYPTDDVGTKNVTKQLSKITQGVRDE